MNTLLETGLSNAAVAGALALAAAGVGYYCRRPAVVHGLWLLVLLKLITPPLVAIPLPWLAAPELGGPAAIAPEPPAPRIVMIEMAAVPVEETEEPPAPARGIALLTDPEPPFVPLADDAPSPPAATPSSCFPWRTVFGVTWLTGSMGWLVLALVRVARFQRMLRHARPAPRPLREQTARLAERLGLARCPGVWLVPGRLSPMLWALGGPPRLLLPDGLLDRLDTEQRATLLAHELAHLKRRDHWVRALELLVTALYWWCPVVWWARHQLREAEEQCCDAWVVWALPGAGRTYATALVDTLDFLCGARAAVPALASGIGQVHDLKRRLTMIMRGTTPRSLTWTGCLGLLVLAALLLPVLPTWAQTERIQKEIEERLQAERALREAEEHLRRLAGDKERGAQVEEARAQVKQIAAQLDQMRAHMKEAEAKLKMAQERLAHLEDRGGAGVRAAVKPGDKEEKIVIIIKDADGKVHEFQIPKDADVLRRIEPALRPRPPVPPVPPTPPAGGIRIERELVPAGGSDARLRELEKRIEGLIREMEALRRELKTPERRKEAPPPDEDNVFFFKKIPGPDVEPMFLKTTPDGKIIYLRSAPDRPFTAPVPPPRR